MDGCNDHGSRFVLLLHNGSSLQQPQRKTKDDLWNLNFEINGSTCDKCAIDRWLEKNASNRRPREYKHPFMRSFPIMLARSSFELAYPLLAYGVASFPLLLLLRIRKRSVAHSIICLSWLLLLRRIIRSGASRDTSTIHNHHHLLLLQSWFSHSFPSHGLFG